MLRSAEPETNECTPWAVADGRIVLGVCCQKCSYDLRSLEITGKCPECGEPILPSLRQNRLCFAPVAWHQRIKRSGHPAITGFVIMIVLLIASVFIAQLVPWEYRFLAATSAIAAPTVLTFGLIWSTFLGTPRVIPFEHGPIDLGPSIWVPRIACLVFPSCILTLVLGAFVGIDSTFVVTVLVVGALLAACIWAIGTQYFAWHLIKAVGEPDIAKLLERAFSAALVAVAIALVATLVNLAFEPVRQSLVAGVTIVVSFLVSLAYVLYYLVRFGFQSERSFSLSLKQAKAIQESREQITTPPTVAHPHPQV